jgi:DNA repair exonuclease SbcCD ATPase subunit
VETLILDEVCAPLDEAGEAALIECIALLKQRFACILLITHRETLRDRLDTQIIVLKNNGVSEVQVNV